MTTAMFHVSDVKRNVSVVSESRDQNNNSPPVRIKKPNGHKVLIQGKPGMGKTTIVKKITFDWAKGKFTSFMIIFLVILKLAEPDESIESVIANQLPEIPGLGGTHHHLKKILDIFGERCLIILDGLDELAPKAKWRHYQDNTRPKTLSLSHCCDLEASFHWRHSKILLRSCQYQGL